MDKVQTLSPEAKRKLKVILAQPQDTTMLLHGEGENRNISFYADGTRLEARIPYPDAEE